jgi:chromosomal replication initiation ATPase DnaA
VSAISQHPGILKSAEKDSGAEQALTEVIAMVSREKGDPIRLLVHVSRCRAETARARHMAMYLAHVVKGISLTSIGAAFGRDRTTVSYACGQIEDMRDDTVFDAELDRLETLLTNMEAMENA